MSLVHLFLSPKGRIGRQDFWFANAVLMAITLAATWLLDPTQLGASLPSTPPAILPLAVLSILVLWCNLSVMIKRLHDRGRPRWIACAAVAAWCAFTVAQHLGPMPEIATLPLHQQSFFHALGFVALWLIIELGFLPGRPDADNPQPALPPPALARTTP